ncbi:hypothetical protein E1301_Tti023636 [Triplophysa tibetana]|nr:hypothetical protein E1301_Tti023636 [Triplophysa tibetana]
MGSACCIGRADEDLIDRYSETVNSGESAPAHQGYTPHFSTIQRSLENIAGLHKFSHGSTPELSLVDQLMLLDFSIPPEPAALQPESPFSVVSPGSSSGVSHYSSSVVSPDSTAVASVGLRLGNHHIPGLGGKSRSEVSIQVSPSMAKWTECCNHPRFVTVVYCLSSFFVMTLTTDPSTLFRSRPPVRRSTGELVN